MVATFWDFVRNQYKTLPIAPTPADCVGKTFIVIGANTGLGFECAQHLVRLSAARVILAVRSMARGDAANAKIKQATGRQGEVWELDLAAYDSVKAFVEKVKSLERLDALICNASIAAMDWSMAEGLETSVTVNVVSTMLLAILTLPVLKASAKRNGEKTRLVIVGSGVAFEAAGVLEGVHGDVLEGLNADKMKGRYPTTKLLQLYSTRQLALLNPPEETGVIINYLSPGLCTTELARSAPLSFKVMITIMRLLVGRTAEQGSRVLLYSAFGGEDTHGKYLADCEVKEYYIPSWVVNEDGAAMQNRVWADLTKRLNTIEPGCI